MRIFQQQIPQNAGRPFLGRGGGGAGGRTSSTHLGHGLGRPVHAVAARTGGDPKNSKGSNQGSQHQKNGQETFAPIRLVSKLGREEPQEGQRGDRHGARDDNGRIMREGQTRHKQEDLQHGKDGETKPGKGILVGLVGIQLVHEDTSRLMDFGRRKTLQRGGTVAERDVRRTRNDGRRCRRLILPGVLRFPLGDEFQLGFVAVFVVVDV
mmetsp:Transcript_30255/g.70716  ORF Transcript_30255/g.70716 Transcript_30255/m.70716 type:complete len:209 (+) Transcript_30255:1275-1901(+)